MSVLNDERTFIPIHYLQERKGRNYEDEYKVVLFNKSSIMTVEEVRS